MSAEHHDTGKAYLPNLAPGVSPAFEPEVQSGRALELGATNDLAIPIHNNGGANSFITIDDIANDEIIQIGNAVDGGSSKELVTNGGFDTDTDWSKNTGWEISGGTANRTITGNGYIYQVDKFEVGKSYIASIGSITGSGSGVTLTYYDGSNFINFGANVTAGTTYTVTIPVGCNGILYIGCNSITSIDNVSVKEILPTSTEYILNDVTVNNILTHQMQFSAGDLSLLQDEPNLLAALAMGEATPISSVTLDADDSWYACSEVNGADVFDARVAGNDTTISGDLTSVRITNQQKGLQTTALLLDANGVPESYNSTPNTARVYDDTIISTGFKPSIARYSIEESVSGELQDFGGELVINGTFDTDLSGWTSNETQWVGGRAYINDIGGTAANLEQSYTAVEGDVLLSVDFEGVWGTIRILNYDKDGAVDLDYDITNQETTTKTFALSNGSSRVRFLRATTNSKAYVDNVSVKELTTKTQRTEKHLLTHTDAKLGVELYNGSTDGWALGTGWSADGTIFTHTGTDGNISKYGVIEVGKRYLYTFEVTGTVRIISSFYTEGVGAYTDGIYSIIISPSNANFYQYMTGDGTLFMKSVKEVSTETKYYIDTVEQTVTPPLPNPTTNLDVGSTTALIGYADTIDTRSNKFRVWSTVRTAAEILADHNAWILANEDVLTDGNGDPLTDGNGVYLYV